MQSKQSKAKQRKQSKTSYMVRRAMFPQSTTKPSKASKAKQAKQSKASKAKQSKAKQAKQSKAKEPRQSTQSKASKTPGKGGFRDQKTTNGIKKCHVGPQSCGALLLLYDRRSAHSSGYLHREI